MMGAVDPRILDLGGRLLTDGPAGADLDALILARPDFALCLSTTDGWADLPLAGAVVGVGPELLARVRDAAVPLIPENPLTGAEWQPGEAAALAAEGLAVGIVTDALVIEVASRDGDGGAWVVPYRRGRARVGDGADGGGLHFGEAQRVGDCPGWLLQAMTIPPADPARVPDPGDTFTYHPDGPFYSPEKGRVALDVGVSRFITRALLERRGAACVYTSAPYAETLRSEGIGFVDVHVM